MKRLITALAALAGAFGLQAASFTDTGTSFEPAEAPTEAATVDFTGNVTTQGELVTSGSFWNLPELSDSVEVKLVTDTTNKEVEGKGAVEKLAAENHYATLSISTGKDAEVERYAKDGGAVVNLGGDNSGVSGTSLHFDSLVKFTAYDQDKTPEEVLGDDGKIAIWVRENLDGNGDPVSTNLIVTAGYITGTFEVIPTNYTCTYSVPAGETLCDWHRVTVKAMQTIVDGETYPGFAIAIDGNVIGTGRNANDKGFGNLSSDLTGFARTQLDIIGGAFPSVQKGMANANVKSVAFKGMGEVDDLVFTEDAPISEFAEGGNITIRGDEYITGFSYAIGDEEAIPVSGNSVTIPHEEGMTVTISGVQLASGAGYVFSGITASYATVSGYVISDIADMASIALNTTLGGAMVDGEAFTTAAAAFDAINNGDITSSGTDPLTVKLVKDVAENIKLDKDGVSVVLDLAGKTITGVSGNDAAINLNAGILTITNTADTAGVVDAGESAAAVWVNGGDIIIADGTYDGVVYALDASSILVSGGKFDISAIEDARDDETYLDPLADNVPENYELVEGTDGDEGYYVVQKIVEWTVTYFDDNDDSYAQSETVKNGKLAQGPETAPVREGYTLAGWETRINGEPYDDDDDLETPEVTPVVTNTFDIANTPITADITLYASWEENSSGLDPASDVIETTVEAESAADAESAAKAGIVKPAGAADGYAEYFKYGVTDNGNGSYTVAITGIVETVEAGVAESAVRRLTDSEAETIAVPAGLYYRITPSAALPIDGTAETGLSAGSVQVTPATANGKGFIKVELSPTAFPAE